MAHDTISHRPLTLTFKEVKAAISRFEEYFMMANIVDSKSNASLALKSADRDVSEWLEANNLHPKYWEKLTSLVCEKSYDRALSLCMQAAQIPGKKISWAARYIAPIARSGGIRFNFFRAILTQGYFEHRDWLDYNEHMFLIKTYGELETTLL
ncbi:hypothetical protein PAEPH01_1402 [Pancytospora epiphaga]|nr:hypothetical protein PAEPH01_1402 [Pancytospora epiphaga]